MRDTGLMVGAFYNPHLGAELAKADGIDHLAMADPPAATDPWVPAVPRALPAAAPRLPGPAVRAARRAVDRAGAGPGGAVRLALGGRALPVPPYRGRRVPPKLRLPAALHRGVPGPLP